jgi:hypothetical protein
MTKYTQLALVNIADFLTSIIDKTILCRTDIIQNHQENYLPFAYASLGQQNDSHPSIFI